MKIHNSVYKSIINKKIYIYLIITLIIGVLLMCVPKFDAGKGHVNTKDAYTVPASADNNGVGLSAILASIEGVGEVEVFLNCKNSDNSDDKKIEGMIIVAEGGGNPEIVSMIQNAIANTYGIPMHKINVLKMNK